MFNEQSVVNFFYCIESFKVANKSIFKSIIWSSVRFFDLKYRHKSKVENELLNCCFSRKQLNNVEYGLLRVKRNKHALNRSL